MNAEVKNFGKGELNVFKKLEEYFQEGGEYNPYFIDSTILLDWDEVGSYGVFRIDDLRGDSDTVEYYDVFRRGVYEGSPSGNFLKCMFRRQLKTGPLC